MAYICEMCGYEAKTAQGLVGHKQFKHQLAGRYKRAREFTDSVELLESQEAQLR